MRLKLLALGKETCLLRSAVHVCLSLAITYVWYNVQKVDIATNRVSGSRHQAWPCYIATRCQLGEFSVSYFLFLY